ncbi:hypothetical protein H2200_010193 [Cladophialophora chaetospira]|uniref:Uncharacterized protein n=1 Tax=Cladophialophora chaetospira TaxID=386627 RepID=A0AA38X2B9_9EURO|nr:hypothetical protein H2200_010193 [Cladophialophora chaetospira]
MAPQHPWPGKERNAQQIVPVKNAQQKRRGPVPERIRAPVNQNTSLAHADNFIDLTGDDEMPDAPAAIEGNPTRPDAAGAYLDPSTYVVPHQQSRNQGAFVPASVQPVARGHQLGFAFLPATFQYGSGELYYVNGRAADLAHRAPLGAVGRGVSSDATPPQIIVPVRDQPQKNSPAAQPGSDEAWRWYEANFRNVGSDDKRQYQHIEGFPPYTVPIPRGVTLTGICRDYPNHLNNRDVLDAAIQYFYSGKDIFDRLSEEFQTAMAEKNEGKSKQTDNVYVKRLFRRWHVLKLEKLRQLIEGPKIRVSEPEPGCRQPYYGRSDPGRDFNVYLNPLAQHKTVKPTDKDGKEPKPKQTANGPRKSVRPKITQPPPSVKGNGPATTALKQRQESVVDNNNDWFLREDPGFDLEGLVAHEFIPIPIEKAPLGSFCGHPFWIAEQEYRQTEISITSQMENAVRLARAVLDADPALGLQGGPVILNEFTELIGWPLAIRKEVVEQWIPGRTPDAIVHAAFPKVISFFMKGEVYKYLVDKNELDPRATAASASGPRLITSLRSAIRSHIPVKMQNIIDKLEEKLKAVQGDAMTAENSLEQRQGPSRGVLLGLERRLEDEEVDDGRVSKLVCLGRATNRSYINHGQDSILPTESPTVCVADKGMLVSRTGRGLPRKTAAPSAAENMAMTMPNPKLGTTVNEDQRSAPIKVEEQTPQEPGEAVEGGEDMEGVSKAQVVLGTAD